MIRPEPQDLETASAHQGLRVGKRHNHHATQAQQAAGSQARCKGSLNAAVMEPKAIITLANCLARSGTARVARQSRTIGPNTRCSSNQRSQRVLPREKQNAASSTKGVVGSSGTKMPMMPRSRLAMPANNHKTRHPIGPGLGRKDSGFAAPPKEPPAAAAKWSAVESLREGGEEVGRGLFSGIWASVARVDLTLQPMHVAIFEWHSSAFQRPALALPVAIAEQDHTKTERQACP